MERFFLNKFVVKMILYNIIYTQKTPFEMQKKCFKAMFFKYFWNDFMPIGKVDFFTNGWGLKENV